MARAVAVRAWEERQSTLAIIDLHLFPGRKFESIELRRFMLDQAAGEALDAVIAGGKSELINQVLVDGGEVAAQQ